ncbi:polyphosphate--glucose phosphotransferase [Schaalia sp. lx-100]|uniref:polyphosphate--glucose phosphotransferase n=1 Tax=Schaalia sp. lx-100 TaxID=2899081 RepID=UPI001E5117DC|nr:ROK family protein [Schaalia sp. lx-100]MCD4557425.1 ROK family protein [Schaalia sp. lx-100]
MARLACGIDIGGSGVKAALVNLDTGEFSTDHIRIETPRPATPDAIAHVCRQLLEGLNVGPEIPVGIAFPAPVINGVIRFMANLDDSWVGIDVNELMMRHLGRPVFPLNDADAAGLAEAVYGAARGIPGVVIVTTQGTGIGSAIILDGVLVPNSELGHLEIDGYDAEKRASAGQKTLQGLDWQQWAERLQRYYSHVEMLFSPDLFVVGGGVSQNHEKFMPLLDLKTPMVPALLLNTAGIVGAAHWAATHAAR